jgi:activator of 2-hydroxyglutaryl-CoA dehydratase
VRRPIRGRLQSCLGVVLEELARAVSDDGCALMAITGARAGAYAELFGVREISPIVAAYRGVRHLVPQAGAALELGGEHSTFLRFGPLTDRGDRVLEDFAVNGACSAGTGAFLEQEAHRFGLSIDEFGRQAEASRRSVRIAGRCAVFAKTDLVHKHQNGIPLDDLACALCLAITQSMADELIGAAPVTHPLALVGGVAANRGMRRALREVLRLEPHELVVPDRPELAGAIGAVLAARERPDRSGPSLSEAIARLEATAPPTTPRVVLAPLAATGGASAPRAAAGGAGGRGSGDGSVLGIDIGSTTTNIVWLETDGEVRDTRSVPTRGGRGRVAHARGTS